jgi:hypothetical protein
MFNLFLRPRLKRIKEYLPNPYLEYRIIFKKGAIEAIKRVKGWRTDAEMARALGLTRAYISMLHKTKVGVSSTVITRLAVCLGNVRGNWWEHYQIAPWGVTDFNHPIYNEEKYTGRIPYDHFSLSADLRNRDYKTEIR